jgi:hypothetical protein
MMQNNATEMQLNREITIFHSFPQVDGKTQIQHKFSKHAHYRKLLIQFLNFQLVRLKSQCKSCLHSFQLSAEIDKSVADSDFASI